jgi:hypothetical protein
VTENGPLFEGYWTLVETAGSVLEPPGWPGPDRRWVAVDPNGEVGASFRSLYHAVRFAVFEETGGPPKGWKKNPACDECHCHG